MKRIVRLTESDLTRIVRRVIKEDETEGCKKPTTSGRPDCKDVEKAKTIGGKIISIDDSVFMMYKDEGNCPTYCKFSESTTYKIA
jgi:hypothetical protein